MLMDLLIICPKYNKIRRKVMKQKTIEFLEAHQSETPSKWREEAEWSPLCSRRSKLAARLHYFTSFHAALLVRLHYFVTSRTKLP